MRRKNRLLRRLNRKLAAMWLSMRVLWLCRPSLAMRVMRGRDEYARRINAALRRLFTVDVAPRELWRERPRDVKVFLLWVEVLEMRIPHRAAVPHLNDYVRTPRAQEPPVTIEPDANRVRTLSSTPRTGAH